MASTGTSGAATSRTSAADPVVVEWRTPVAEPFYQARPATTCGLVRRRHLMVEARRVLSIADDVFGAGRRTWAKSASVVVTRSSPSSSGPVPG